MLCEGLLITFVVFLLVSFKFLPSLFLEIMGSHKFRSAQVGVGLSFYRTNGNGSIVSSTIQYKTVHRTGESQMLHRFYGMTKVH